MQQLAQRRSGETVLGLAGVGSEGKEQLKRETLEAAAAAGSKRAKEQLAQTFALHPKDTNLYAIGLSNGTVLVKQTHFDDVQKFQELGEPNAAEESRNMCGFGSGMCGVCVWS